MANQHDFIKKSGTGNQQSQARNAPLSARDSELLGSERTSDAQEASAIGKRPQHSRKQLQGGEQRRKLKSAK